MPFILRWSEVCSGLTTHILAGQGAKHRQQHTLKFSSDLQGASATGPELHLEPQQLFVSSCSTNNHSLSKSSRMAV